MGATTNGRFKNSAEEQKMPYGYSNAPYANAYSKPLNETQVNGTFTKRAATNNMTRGGQTGGGFMGNGYGRSGTATGSGVKEALTY